jgi:hypothetical protein
VKGLKTQSLVQTWSTRNISIAHTGSNEIFRRWYELKPHQTEYQFITVYDDVHSAFKPEDLAILHDYSNAVFAFPTQRESFGDAIRA